VLSSVNRPLIHVHALAPIRICDNGGWTDTWFAQYGKIFNIAVSPCAQVQITAFADPDQAGRVTISAENYGDRYTVVPSEYFPKRQWDRHPLLEAAIGLMQPPQELHLEIKIYCEAPGGASTGTSAAVGVALIGALDHLRGGRMTPHEIADAAQRVETEILGQQCGIQDQLCSAYGGINYIEMQ